MLLQVLTYQTSHELCITQYGHCYVDTRYRDEDEKLGYSDKSNKSIDL